MELGLDHGINYAEQDFADEVRRLTDGRGADVIVESVGGQVLQDSLRCLAYRGRCVSVGDAGRAPGQPLDISTHAGQQPDADRLLPRRRALPRRAGLRR